MIPLLLIRCFLYIFLPSQIIDFPVEKKTEEQVTCFMDNSHGYAMAGLTPDAATTRT